MENKPSYYKYCIVPLCKSTTFVTPSKIYIRLPDDPVRRNKWLKACRRDKSDIKRFARFLCKDHFKVDTYILLYILL